MAHSDDECPVHQIDWTDPKTAKLKQFLQEHVLAMQHCDEEEDDLGLCECVHRLADWWAEQQVLLERAIGLASEGMSYTDDYYIEKHEMDKELAELKQAAGMT